MLKNFPMLKADIGIGKKLWNFCNNGLPLTNNSYQVLRAKFRSTTSKSFKVVTIKIILHHYPTTGQGVYFIPDKLWKYNSIEELVRIDAYKICRILYLHENDHCGSNDEYLSFMSWDKNDHIE